MAISTITIADLPNGRFSIELEHDTEPKGTDGEWSRAQQMAMSIAQALADLTGEDGGPRTVIRSTCSCPSGDGSLRHPCAVHPEASEAKA